MGRKTDRQKYNFLAAWTSQLDEACDDNDDLAQQVQDVLGLTEMNRTITELCERMRSYEEREPAMEELDDDGGEGLGEEPWPDDDGDDDHELGVVQPAVGGVPQGHGRVAPAVAGASNGESARRGIGEHRRANRVRPKPELKRVKRG